MVRFRPLLGPTLWFLPALAVLIELGVWQIERLHEKEVLLAAIAIGMRAEPISLDDALPLGIQAAEWHRVRVSGRFQHEKETYLFALGPMGAIGAHVLTPLVADSGKTILIDRGFVPEAL